MELLVTYGALAVFFAVVVAILQRSYVADRDFSDFTVAGRSFGGFYQAMAFLNTGLPGFMYLGAFGFIVRAGVLGIGISTLLATVVMYLMADRVWTWGATHELRTQPDLMALRYDSRAVRIVSALLGIFGLMPWMVLGMQALGAVFYALSLGHLSFATSVVLGVTVMALRQVWTIRMGMRGIIISDLFQGIVAYFLGSALIIGLIAWLYSTGSTLDQLPAEKFMLPGPELAPAPALLLADPTAAAGVPVLARSLHPPLYGLRRRERQALVGLLRPHRARVPDEPRLSGTIGIGPRVRRCQSRRGLVYAGAGSRRAAPCRPRRRHGVCRLDGQHRCHGTVHRRAGRQ